MKEFIIDSHITIKYSNGEVTVDLDSNLVWKREWPQDSDINKKFQTLSSNLQSWYKTKYDLGLLEKETRLKLKLLRALSEQGDLLAKIKLREGIITLSKKGEKWIKKLMRYFDCGELLAILGLNYSNIRLEFERDHLWDKIGLLDLLPIPEETHKKVFGYFGNTLESKIFEHSLHSTLEKGGLATLEPILQFLMTPYPKDLEYSEIHSYLVEEIAYHADDYYKDYEGAKKFIFEFVRKNPISSNLEGYKIWYFNFVLDFLKNDFWKIIDNGDEFLELARIWYKEPKYYEIGYDMGVDRVISILIEKNQIIELWLDFDQSYLFIEDYNKIYGEKIEDMRRLISSFSSLKKIYVYELMRLDQVYDDKDNHTLEFFQFLVNLKTLRTMFDDLKQKGIEIEYVD